MRAIFLIPISLVLLAGSCETTTTSSILPDEGPTSQASIKRIAETEGKTEAEVTAFFEDCVSQGGQPLIGGFGQAACEKPSPDAGKACTQDADCEGFCLADSKTCSPLSPQFGCFDVLPNGNRATICVD